MLPLRRVSHLLFEPVQQSCVLLVCCATLTVRGLEAMVPIHESGDAVLPASSYNEMPEEELRATLVQRDRELEGLKRSLSAAQKSLRQARARRERRIHQLKQQVAQYRAQAAAQDAFSLQRVKTKVLTVPSRCALAILRNASNVAGLGCSVVFRTDVSKDTVYRCEVQTQAALLASSQSFFDHVKEAWSAVDAAGVLGAPEMVSCISYRHDATNSSIWQRRKLQTMQVHSASSVDPTLAERARELDFDDVFVAVRRYPDLLPVEVATMLGTMSLVLKQLRAAGCFDWRMLQCVAWAKAGVFVINDCSDNGGDCAALKRQIEVECFFASNVLAWPTDCLIHSYHLAVRSSFGLIDSLLQGTRSWRYFSTVAKIMNVWREVLPGFFATFRQFYGAQACRVTRFGLSGCRGFGARLL